jgi:hypothetical protein
VLLLWESCTRTADMSENHANHIAVSGASGRSVKRDAGRGMNGGRRDMSARLARDALARSVPKEGMIARGA